MGVTFPDGVVWPEERTSWTAAAVLLAYDALHDVTPAGKLFNHLFWTRNPNFIPGNELRTGMDLGWREASLPRSGG
jgi:hypothetical protein